MAPLVKALQACEQIESIVCLTGQHREMLDSVMEIFRLTGDYDLHIMEKRQTLSTITTKTLLGMDEVLNTAKPDLVLVHGDTSTTFAGALAAFYHQVKVGHVEAGLRTWDKYSPFPEEMNRTLVGDIADLHFSPTKANADNLRREAIMGDIFITGNTAMLYLLRGYDVRDIALAPFQARHLFGESVPARELGLDWGADCQVYLPPCLSAYVGADITCGLLACDILHARGPALLADVGTNGEMALLSDGTIYCCATAAGPAFEGVGISCGSGAVPGAIDAVTAEDGALHVHVIGGGEARSLCGSGLLDAVAALRRLELVEDSGCMEENSLPLSGSVSLLRRDIRSFQLAKAAVCAGVDTLLRAAGRAASEVETVWLAGGFGCKLSPDSAGAVGLLPRELIPAVRPSGNTAAMGAALLLCSRRFEAETVSIAAAARLVDLSASPVFQQRFVEDMTLSEVTS